MGKSAVYLFFVMCLLGACCTTKPGNTEVELANGISAVDQGIDGITNAQNGADAIQGTVAATEAREDERTAALIEANNALAERSLGIESILRALQDLLDASLRELESGPRTASETGSTARAVPPDH